eukprot:ANDGO_07906.mRNA.1 hypothetical protein SAMD00019534_021390
MATMPVMFARLPFTKVAMAKFRIAVLLGLTVCYILNVLWTYFILSIVPQTSSSDSSVSLQRSQEKGEPATVPLSQVLKDEYPQFEWAAFLIDFFILISVTISYITMSSGMKHTIDGMVVDLRETRAFLQRYSPSRLRFSGYFMHFGFIFLVAIFNPSGFLVFLEVFTALTLNMEAGFFVVVMLYVARRMTKSGPATSYELISEDGPASPASVPLPLPENAYKLSWAVLGYFVLASVYDVVISFQHHILGQR